MADARLLNAGSRAREHWHIQLLDNGQRTDITPDMCSRFDVDVSLHPKNHTTGGHIHLSCTLADDANLKADIVYKNCT
jgi:hypothetical protein